CKMRLNSYIEFLISILIILTVTRTWSRTVRFTGLSCQDDDPSFSRFENCILRAKSWEIKEVSIVVKLLKVPVDNVTVRAEIWKRSFTSQSIYHFEIDGCQFFVNKRRNAFAKALYGLFRLDSFTNLNHTCPYDVSSSNVSVSFLQLINLFFFFKFQHDIIVDRLQISTNLNMPLPLPKGDYILKCYWLAYNVLRATTTTTMQIV
ncbi:hypothetical protein KR044_003840, partial [Drosophila immigrans]